MRKFFKLVYPLLIVRTELLKGWKPFFNCDTAYRVAKIIQRVIYNHMGLYVTIGIGDNPLLAKLDLDNEAKNTPGFVAEWRYEDGEEKIWVISTIMEFCGIGNRMAARLKMSGSQSIYELAHADPYLLKQRFDVMGFMMTKNFMKKFDY